MGKTKKEEDRGIKQISVNRAQPYHRGLEIKRFWFDPPYSLRAAPLPPRCSIISTSTQKSSRSFTATVTSYPVLFPLIGS
ncbi:hypothetical protein VNO77_40020 [Canavalia gladiata]|uniref:Uncharacterized protein n=1 Tax=Canavalia gladiata TaxID=3824 RepID=A0AAN9PPE1_CANGL